jgi:outer membrane protein
VISGRSAVESAKLSLMQLMNLPYEAGLQLDRASADVLPAPYGASAAEVFQQSLEQLALVKAVDLRRKSAEAGVLAARGLRAPSIVLSGNVNTNYSSAATREIILGTENGPTGMYVDVNGTQVPVFAPQRKTQSEKIIYGSQLSNNIFTSINLGVRIPLFNAGLARNNIRLAQINLKNTELIAENTKVRLRQQVELAHVNMTAAWDRYKALQEQVAAYGASFRAAEVRYNAGAGTSVDYLIAKNNLDRAQVNLVAAQYDYVLRARILDYYRAGK